MFAKLYSRLKEQVLVVIDTDNEGKPQVLFSFNPEGFGICSGGPVWPDTDKGWEGAERYFAHVTRKSAFTFVENLKSELFDQFKGQ